MVDELPNQLAETLLGEAVMTFSAVPEPTEEDLLEVGYLGRDEVTGKRQRPGPDANEVSPPAMKCRFRKPIMFRTSIRTS